MENITNTLENYVLCPAQSLFTEGVSRYSNLRFKVEDWTSQFVDKVPYGAQLKEAVGKLFLGLPIIALYAISSNLTFALGVGAAALYTWQPEAFKGRTWKKLAPMVMFGAAAPLGVTAASYLLQSAFPLNVLMSTAYGALSGGLVYKANQWEQAEKGMRTEQTEKAE